jgi:NADPH:quinone reductase-like Zn-dependent oxidoreductase
MKAVLSPKAGPPEVLELGERPKPEPGRGELLVRVRYSTVCRGDTNLRKFPRPLLAVLGVLFGFKAMKTPGMEFAGDVEAAGPEVSRFAFGDAVCGTATGMVYGSNAEYVLVPEAGRINVVAPKPETLTYREAAALPVGSMTATQLLRPASIEKGARVLIYGASGSVGSYAVQLARAAGAHVTALCSGANAELMRSLGAEKIIDYTREDFTQTSERYDVVFDAVGKASKKACKSLLAPGGRYTNIKPPTKEVLSEFEDSLKLAAEGSIKVPIDREFGLEEIVEAHRYVEGGHKRGNVSIRVAP